MEFFEYFNLLEWGRGTGKRSTLASKGDRVEEMNSENLIELG